MRGYPLDPILTLPEILVLYYHLTLTLLCLSYFLFYVIQSWLKYHTQEI